MTEKATIHFTEEHAYLLSDKKPESGDKVLTEKDGAWEFRNYPAPLPYWTNSNNCRKIIAELPLTPELEKLRLEAVIQKEAENLANKFCKEELKEEPDDENLAVRKIFVHGIVRAGQSIIERLPSGGFDKTYCKYRLNREDEFNCIYSGMCCQKLLPSLPSTLSCEVEEENGKVTVKSMKI